jgi:hypothetical protein
VVPAQQVRKNRGMTDLVAPGSTTCFPLPRTAGSDETIMLSITRGAAEYFNLWSLPVPPTWRYWPPDGGRAYWPRRRTRLAGLGYRIAYRAPDHPGGYRLARFCLEKGHTQHSLKVFCDHLDDRSDKWLWLTDRNGARLSDGLFHAKPRP